ncbi:ABC transporter ATP-binding protein [Paenibacillus sp. GCM10012307]|uniref:ABC transporter ATP-binding protein n=1 Tax=Paenibacillus roseus TaxID=2798579 RepID=A0A934JBR6_9BACL|nr:ABC transporter ATP-binding protein [Paenibacillus roseus]MBJ6363898.1 ABC transporter ATP-binding protein [Paenibacillus roseus]
MIQLEDVNKSYEGRPLLTNFSINIDTNQFVTITGRSGSGKSTLLNIMSLLDVPDKGTVKVRNILNPDRKKTQWLRRFHFGYIFQNYVLMNQNTVEENLLLSTQYSKKVSSNELIGVLEKVKLDGSYLKKRIYQLSGGEQQRLAIARIILKPCDIIFADEPTGNLDHHNKKIILSLFHELQQKGKTIVCVTHDAEIAKQSDKNIEL